MNFPGILPSYRWPIIGDHFATISGLGTPSRVEFGDLGRVKSVTRDLQPRRAPNHSRQLL